MPQVEKDDDEIARLFAVHAVKPKKDPKRDYAKELREIANKLNKRK